MNENLQTFLVGIAEGLLLAAFTAAVIDQIAAALKTRRSK